jgi:phage terminase small subunit
LTPAALAEFHRLRDVLVRRGWLEFTEVGILETAARLHDVSERLYPEIEERGLVIRLPNSYYAENPAFRPWMACVRLRLKLVSELALTPRSYRPAPVSAGGGSSRWGRLLRVGDGEDG